MTTYGGYETVEQLAKRGQISLWSARRQGDAGAAAFAVKLFEPAASAPAEEALRAGARLLHAAVVQGRAAELGGAHGAPVLVSGRAQDAVYVVMHRYGKSFQELIEAGHAISAPVLGALATAVVQGLIELRDSCERGHGNLKPSNVFLEGPPARANARLADVSSEAPADGRQDLRALGGLLCRLVNPKLPASAADEEMLAQDAWSRLGATGSKWRELAAQFLACPAAAPALEEVLARIEALRARRRSPVSLAMVGVLAGVLAVAGWCCQSHWKRQAALPVSAPEVPSAQLLRAAAANYRQRGWNKAAASLAQMADGLKKAADGLESSSQGLPLPRRIEQVLQTEAAVAALEEKYARLGELEGPIILSGEKGVLKSFGEVVAADLCQADQSVGEAFFRNMGARIDHADEVAHGLLPYVAHWRNNVLHGQMAAWQAPAPLTLATYETQWPQALLRPQVLRAPSDVRGGPWRQEVDRLARQIAQGVEQLKRQGDSEGVDNVLARQEKIDAATDELAVRPASVSEMAWVAEQAQAVKQELAALKTDVEGRVASNRLDVDLHPLANWDWQAELARVRSAMDQLPAGAGRDDYDLQLQMIEDSLDRQMPHARPWSRDNREAIEDCVAAAREQLTALAAVAAGGMPARAAAGAAEDPRGSAWKNAVSDASRRIRDQLAHLREEFGASAAARCEDRLAALEAQAQQLGDPSLKWTKANEAQILDGAAAVAAGLTRLERDVAGQMAAGRMQMMDEAARRSWSSPAIERWWNVQLAAMARADLPVAAFRSGSHALAELAGELDRLPAEVAAVPAGAGEKLSALVADQRNRAMAKALAAARFEAGAGEEPVVDRQAWEQPQKDFRQWHEQVSGFLADMKTLQDRLDLGLGREDPSVKDLVQKWAGRQLYSDLAAYAPALAKTLAQLEQISSGKLSPEQLIALGEDPSTHVAAALAAWRQLKTADGAAGKSYHERAIRMMLRSSVRLQVADADRRQAILNELGTSSTLAAAAEPAE
jgi:hypothetical protein